MRMLVEILLTLALAFLGVKLGWIGAILFVVLYLVAFSFKLSFLSNRVQMTPRFIFFLALFLTFALFMGFIISLLLADYVPENGDWSNNVLKFLLGEPTLIQFWSLIGGLLVAAITAAILLLPYGLVARSSLYSQYENYEGHEREAAMSAISSLLGISRGTWIVSNGQAEARGDTGGALTRFGGPGILIVQEGHAVILEVSGKLSRVARRGITMLRPFERISMVVPLYMRGETVVLEHLTTRDHLIIDEFEFLVYHKVDVGDSKEPEQKLKQEGLSEKPRFWWVTRCIQWPSRRKTAIRDWWNSLRQAIRAASQKSDPEPVQKSNPDLVENGLFPYNRKILLEKIWTASGGDWRNAIRSVAQTAGRDVFGRYPLEKLVTISEPFRSELKDQLIEAMNKITKDKMGIKIAAVDFNRIKLSEEIEAQLLDLWASQQRAEVEDTRSAAQARMLGAISNALSGADKVDALVRLHFLETLKKITQDPAAKIYFPNDMPRYLSDQDIDLQAVKAAGAGGGNANPTRRDGQQGTEQAVG